MTSSVSNLSNSQGVVSPQYPESSTWQPLSEKNKDYLTTYLNLENSSSNSNIASAPYYLPAKNAIDSTKKYCNVDVLDLEDRKQQHVAQLALQVSRRNFFNDETSVDPTWSREDKLIAAHLLSCMQIDSNRQSEKSNFPLECVRKLWEFGKDIGSGCIGLVKYRKNYIDIEVFKPITPENANSGELCQILKYNLDLETRTRLHTAAHLNTDGRVTNLEAKVDGLQKQLQTQTDALTQSAKDQFVTDSLFLTVFFNNLYALKDSQNEESERFFKLDERTVEQLKKVGPTLEALQNRGETASSNTPQARVQSPEDPKSYNLTEIAARTVHLMATLVHTYGIHSRETKNDQRAISAQRKYLKETVYAETRKWGKELESRDFKELRQLALPQIETRLSEWAISSYARSHFINREENFKRFEENLETCRAGVARCLVHREVLDQGSDRASQASETSVNNYDKRIRRDQKRLKNTGKHFTWIKTIGTGIGTLISYYNPVVGQGVTAGLNLMAQPMGNSYERQKRNLDKLIASCKETNQIYQLTGAILDSANNQNKVLLNYWEQREGATLNDLLEHPELYTPKAYCDGIRATIVSTETRISEGKIELGNISQQLSDARICFDWAFKSLEYQIGHPEKDRDLKKIEEFTALVYKHDASIRSLQIEELNQDQFVTGMEKELKKLNEKETEALALLPFQEDIYRRLESYSPNRDQISRLALDGFNAAIRIQHEGFFPVRQCAYNLHELLGLTKNLIHSFNPSFDPENNYRIPQTGYLAIQVVEFYSVLQVLKEGAFALTTDYRVANGLKDIWQCLIDPKWWLNFNLNAFSTTDLLTVLANPSLGCMIQGVKIFSSLQGWWYKTMPEDPQFSIIKDGFQRLGEHISNQTNRLLQNQTHQSKVIHDALSHSRNFLSNQSNQLANGLKKLKNITTASLVANLESKVNREIRKRLEKKLNTKERIENFAKIITTTLSHNDLNPFTIIVRDRKLPIKPPLWIAARPAWYTSLLNHTLNSILGLPVDSRIANMELLVNHTNLFVQKIRDLIAINLNSKKQDTATDRALIEGIKSASKSIRQEVSRSIDMLRHLRPFFKRADSIRKECQKGIFRNINTSKAERRQLEREQSLELVGPYLEAKKAIELKASCYMIDLCYRLTRVTLKKFDPEQIVIPVKFFIPMKDMAIKAGTYTGGIVAGAMTAAVGVAAVTALTVPTLVVISTVATLSLIAPEFATRKVSNYLKGTLVENKLESLIGKTVKQIILNNNIRISTTYFGNQLQATLGHREWVWSNSSLFHSYLGLPIGNMSYKADESPNFYFPGNFFTDPSHLIPLEVVLSSTFTSPSLYFFSRLISYDEVEHIPEATEIQKDFKARSEKLFEAYDQFLKDLLPPYPSSSNIFVEKLGSDYQLIPPVNTPLGPKFPLAFPKVLIEKIELDLEYLHIYQLGDYKISYQFLETSGGGYCLLFEIIVNNNGIETVIYQHPIAQIDQKTVSCFKKVTQISVQDTDRSDLLLLAMYTNFIPDLGMPTEAYFETNSKLVATMLEPFAGFYSIWSKNGPGFIDFNSKVHSADKKYVPITRFNIPTPNGQMLEERAQEEETRFKVRYYEQYTHLYRQFKAYCCLISNKTAAEINQLIHVHLHWFDPDSIDNLGEMKANALLSKPNITTFQTILKATPSRYAKDLAHLELELKKIEDTI